MKKAGFLFLFFYSFLGFVSPKGRVIVIGASAGMGREVARVFCNNGYLVGGVARRADALERAQEEFGENFSYRVADIRADSSCAVVRELIQSLGGCDIFVVSAGIWGDIRSEVSHNAIASYDWEKLLQDQLATIDTNIAGFVRMASVAFEFFTKAGRGHFVGISSVDAVRGNPSCPVYSGTKAFESTFMQGVRSAFDQTGFDISVTDIRPGYVATYDMGAQEQGGGVFWVESVQDAGLEIFKAIMNKKKVAYIKARWGLFAGYLSLAPDSIYNFVANNFGLRSFEVTPATKKN